MPASLTLTLAHSPDPDDVFMWWPITGMIDPSDHARITRPPVLDTGRFTFHALPADIDVLNRRAIDAGDLDITALSIFAWARVADRYALTSCGGSFGEGYGPKLVAPESLPTNPLIAIPGSRTTAFLLLSLALRQTGTPFRTLELPFDQILRAVAEQRADAGLLIHQSQLTYADLGLSELLDLGAWWLDRTGLPLPLGGNALRRDLERLHGPGTLREITSLLDRSIRHALDHRDESTDYAMRFAPDISRAQADRYIDMYVSPLTLDAGSPPDGRGHAAIQRLLTDAAALGLCSPVASIDLIRPV
ncbi:MAG: menaquinone biosynthesis family protein [Phycisphaerales bacterium]